MDLPLLWMALGLVLIIEGLPYFLMPERALTLFRQLEKLGPATLRVLGLAAMLAGTALLIFGRWSAG